MTKTDACGMLDIVLISFLHATFKKIGENDSPHKLSRMLQASSEFNLIYLFFIFLFYFLFYFFDDLHLQIIESISPKASVDNSSAQCTIFL